MRRCHHWFLVEVEPHLGRVQVYASKIAVEKGAKEERLAVADTGHKGLMPGVSAFIQDRTSSSTDIAHVVMCT